LKKSKKQKLADLERIFKRRIKMEKKKTHYDRVLEFLQYNGKITSMQAINKFGATRLSAIIFNLRKNGYAITTKFITEKNRYGNKVSFGVYILD
jgi:hypothetical protein